MRNTICFKKHNFLLFILILLSLISYYTYFINNKQVQINIKEIKNEKDKINNKNNNNEEFTDNNVIKNNINNKINNKENFIYEDERVYVDSNNNLSNNNNTEYIITDKIETPIVDPIYERDRNAFTDPLSPPTRRQPRHVYNDVINYNHFYNPTRGYPDSYHYMGNLVRKEDEKIVKLFGRQTYPNSNKYEYYGITTDKHGGELKIKIDSKIKKNYIMEII